jgi:hypothetical protein
MSIIVPKQVRNKKEEGERAAMGGWNGGHGGSPRRKQRVRRFSVARGDASGPRRSTKVRRSCRQADLGKGRAAVANSASAWRWLAMKQSRGRKKGSPALHRRRQGRLLQLCQHLLGLAMQVAACQRARAWRWRPAAVGEQLRGSYMPTPL